MLLVSAPVMLVFGVMDRSHLETGLPMLREQIPIQAETLLSRLDGIQFSLAVRSRRLRQPSA